VTVIFHPNHAIAAVGAPQTNDNGAALCGDEENRTPNPRLAKAVLCQLSYVP
jgi:hypothetical protein